MQIYAQLFRNSMFKILQENGSNCHRKTVQTSRWKLLKLPEKNCSYVWRETVQTFREALLELPGVRCSSFQIFLTFRDEFLMLLERTLPGRRCSNFQVGVAQISEEKLSKLPEVSFSKLQRKVIQTYKLKVLKRLVMVLATINFSNLWS